MSQNEPVMNNSSDSKESYAKLNKERERKRRPRTDGEKRLTNERLVRKNKR